MSWLQNVIAIVISFFIARIMIDAGVHRSFVRYLLKRSGSDCRSFIGGILFTSYFFSIFFSNTVVVLSMIPMVKLIMDGIEQPDLKKNISSTVVLALIYGANIGGMGSLTGSPLNIMYVGILELNKVPGRENITFFSWMLLGIPVSLALVYLSRFVLRLGTRKTSVKLNIHIEDFLDKHTIKKYSIFFVVNLGMLVLLTALQFWLKPQVVAMGLNPIDMLMVLYLLVFFVFSFIVPRGRGKTVGKAGRNAVFLLLFILLFVPVYIVETFKDVAMRYRLRILGTVRKVDLLLLKVFNLVWFFFFGEPIKSLKRRNESCYLSLNRLVYDLPFFGLLFMGVVLAVLFFIFSLGDNPNTGNMDGYISVFLEKVSVQLIPPGDQVFLFLLIVIMVAIFFTEVANNTVVVLILFPLVLNITKGLDYDPIFALLAVTIAASGAFMTPIATSVNAISYASFKEASLKKMLGLGILMNIVSGLYFTLLFYIMG
ncbi:MAG: hypothetical protein GY765_26405 [bacterium]|nr:hypothetical protein [bacterium]